eukprot:TRINITY_DN3302_c0_g1_i5.p1 TRINITY_DN3302_c0_g1~~TRINITY_DN3302_c0_g1_i5.p1  ORF type:complete len:515 (+),score=151.68 TRINITY_DN3302_c0_g1_i5:58-1602(+)
MMSRGRWGGAGGSRRWQVLQILLLCFAVLWYDGMAKRAEAVSRALLAGGTAAPALERKGSCYYRLAPTAKPHSVCVERGQVWMFNAGGDDDGVEVELCNGFPQRRPEGSLFRYNKRAAAAGVRAWEAGGKVVHAEPRRTLFVQTTMEGSLFHLVRDTLANVEDMLLKEVGPGDVRGPQRVFILPSHPTFEPRRQNRFYLFFLGLTGTAPGALSKDVMRVNEIPAGDVYCMTGDVWFGQSFKGYEQGPPGRLVEFKRRALQALQITQEVYVPPGRGGEEGGEGIPLMMIERFSEKKDTQPGRPAVDRKLGNWDAVEAKARELGFAPFKYVYQDHSVVEQLAAAARTRVMLGTHGQALTWSMFMPDWSVTFEILIWGDKRPDYPLLSRWSCVHWVRVPVDRPEQVEFPTAPGMTAQEKLDLNFFKPSSNYHLRQEMILYPDLPVVEDKLREAKELLEVHRYRDLGSLVGAHRRAHAAGGGAPRAGLPAGRAARRKQRGRVRRRGGGEGGGSKLGRG